MIEIKGILGSSRNVSELAGALAMGVGNVRS